VLRTDSCAYLISVTLLAVHLLVMSSYIRVSSSIIHDVALIGRPRARDRVRGIRLWKGLLHGELDGSERRPMVMVWPRMRMQGLN